MALVVGDTIGHVSPALALADALQAHAAHVTMIGTPDSVAAEILAREQVSFLAVPGAPIRRARPLAAVGALWVTTRAIASARDLLGRHPVDLVVGFGGFATGAVLVAARSLGVATAIHEANVEPGLANRWLRRIVDRSFAAHADALHGATVVGMPVRSVFVRSDAARPDPAPARLRVLVTSGSRGSGFFATVMPAAARLAVDAGVAIEIVQQVPHADPSALAATYRGMGVPARLAVRLEDMAAAYAHADVAVTRGGANTLAELAASALPAAVVPLADAAANHQQGNADRWSASGAGPMVLEAPAAATTVAEWLVMMARSRERWRAASAAARSLHQPGAAERLAEYCGTMARTTP